MTHAQYDRKVKRSFSYLKRNGFLESEAMSEKGIRRALTRLQSDLGTKWFHQAHGLAEAVEVPICCHPLTQKAIDIWLEYFNEMRGSPDHILIAGLKHHRKSSPKKSDEEKSA